MFLENDFLKIEVTTKGGSFTSIFDKTKNEELLYQINKDSWQGQDIFIFPFIARLKDGYYLNLNKKYELKNHGLIRYMEGVIESLSKDKLTITFESNEETLARYPFKFKASITYQIIQKTIEISYKILNLNENEMPFMLGAHPAFRLPGKLLDNEFNIDGNYLIFNNKENISRIRQDDSFSFCIDEEPDFIKGSRLDLSKKLFSKIDTIILKADDFNQVLLNKTNGSKLNIKIGNAPYVALWSDGLKGDLICIEPWFGLPDYLEPEREIIKKKAINILESYKSFNYKYIIEVI